MRLIDADHLKSILQEYVKREKSYVELGEFPTKLIASCMISGLEEAIAQIDSEPSAQPTETSCWGCNCPKMERLKKQKTFSEMVHLHDTERRQDEQYHQV